MMNSAINLRTTPRLMRKASDFWQININHDELITRNIIDLSPTGISFKAPLRSQFELGQQVSLQVRLSAEKTFEALGKIVWIRDQQLGVKLSKIPAFIDAFIMRAIQEAAVQSEPTHWEKNNGVAKSLSHLRAAHKTNEARQILSTTIGLITIAAMTAALVMAAYLHQRSRPESGLSNISSKFFNKFNTNTNNGPGK